MKFHCDRCKTRYSIADDRVRGKILKIRCKNCSAVITVREEPGAEEHASESASGTSGASAAAPKEALSTDTAPPWFVAVGGIQHGPMPLSDAMAWVARRNPAEALYCWTDGFEDWKSVEDVEHFANLRKPPEPGDEPDFEGETRVAPPLYREGLAPGNAAGARAAGRGGAAESAESAEGAPTSAVGEEAAADAAGAEAAEAAKGDLDSAAGADAKERAEKDPDSAAGAETPESAGSQVPEPPRPARSESPRAGAPEFVAPPETPQSGGEPGGEAPAPSAAAGDPADSGSLDFEFDEASRVVDLATLRPALSGDPSGTSSAPAAAPGVAKRSGTHTGQGDEPPAVGAGFADAALRRRRGRYVLPIAIGGGAIIAAAGVALAMLVLGGSGDDGDEDPLARSTLPQEHLGYRVEIEPVEPDDDPRESEADEPAEEASRPRKQDRRRSSPESSEPETAPADPPPPTDSEDKEDRAASSNALVGDTGGEVELGERESSQEQEQSLTPDDLLETYKANRFLITRCYNRALAADPELDVKSARVTVTVEPSGSVADVSIPSLAGTDLGACLQSRIEGWSFPSSQDVFTGEFRMMFGK